MLCRQVIRMHAVKERYEGRVKEIELYFCYLKAIDDILINSEEKSRVNEEFFKILKANSLLMMYNLVESTVLGGLLKVYDELSVKSLGYKDVSEEIREIWFNFKFSKAYDKSAHFNSYKKVAHEIVEKILANEKLVMDRKATDISGNLDAASIKEVCKRHGISYDESCGHGGAVLKDVKTKRNELAHGIISYAECGRNYTLNELIKMKDDCIDFLNEVLRSFDEYMNRRGYIS